MKWKAKHLWSFVSEFTNGLSSQMTMKSNHIDFYFVVIDDGTRPWSSKVEPMATKLDD